MILLCFVAATAAAAGVLFQSMALLLLSLGGMAAVVPVRLRSRRIWMLRSAAMIVLLLVTAASMPIMAREVQRRLDTIDRALTGKGRSALARHDKTAIYLFGLIMAGAGFLVYPEAAREHAMLYFQGPSVRRWRSDFAMLARVVKEPLADFARRCASMNGDSVISMEPRVITFRYAKDPYRVALALNPCMVRAQARRAGGDWRIHAVCSVRVEYPRRSRVTIRVPLAGPVSIEEGLFHALQECGWIHPYTTEWEWTVFASRFLR